MAVSGCAELGGKIIQHDKNVAIMGTIWRGVLQPLRRKSHQPSQSQYTVMVSPKIVPIPYSGDHFCFDKTYFSYKIPIAVREENYQNIH